MLTSLINSKLLHPDPRVDGFGVGVNSVPVGVGEPVESTGTNTSPFVEDGAGDGNGKAVFVVVAVDGRDVSVEVGASAVCVSKIDAASVPTPAVRMAFTSASPLSSVAVPPQETSNSPHNIRMGNSLFRTEAMKPLFGLNFLRDSPIISMIGFIRSARNPQCPYDSHTVSEAGEATTFRMYRGQGSRPACRTLVLRDNRHELYCRPPRAR